MYININKNRLQSCKESSRDELRYLYYDLSNAPIDSNHSQPMLIGRHNVASGMVLVIKLK